MIELKAIYILWLREMKKLSRAKERIFGSLAMPIMFLAFLGMGFKNTTIPGLDRNITYISFLVPGVIGLNMLFGSMFSGISVLWDREFGFLKEIMVAPVSRTSIALGRVAGGMTMVMIQGTLLLLLSFIFHFSMGPDFSALRMIAGIGSMYIFMILMSITFISLGLSFASNMRDAQGFDLIINFVMFPLFFVSGALAPISNLPGWLRFFCYLNPLTYGVDGIRASLTQYSVFPLYVDLFVCVLIAFGMLSLASYFFERSDSV